MEELWEVRCEGEEEWTEEVRLAEQDMHTLLQMLLCRTLAHHEIIAALTGENAHLLEIGEESGMLYTAGPNLARYAARRKEP